MMVEGSRASRGQQRTLCCCARPPRATSRVHEKVRNPARGVRICKVTCEAKAGWPEEACPADMHNWPRAKECTNFLPQPSKLLAAHLFAAVVELDEVHSVAPDLKDWDWLGVDEELAELGDVTSSTAPAPTTRTCVTFSRRRSTATEKKRGVGGCICPCGVDRNPSKAPRLL